MIFDKNAEPIDLRTGIYRHYKGPLYQVMGYSHNSSDDNNIQVLYIGLELDTAKVGPRFATRDWKEFFSMVCTHHDGGLDPYSDEHYDRRHDICNEKDWVERFTYLGPVYYKGMESK